MEFNPEKWEEFISQLNESDDDMITSPLRLAKSIQKDMNTAWHRQDLSFLEEAMGKMINLCEMLDQ